MVGFSEAPYAISGILRRVSPHLSLGVSPSDEIQCCALWAQGQYPDITFGNDAGIPVDSAKLWAFVQFFLAPARLRCGSNPVRSAGDSEADAGSSASLPRFSKRNIERNCPAAMSCGSEQVVSSTPGRTRTEPIRRNSAVSVTFILFWESPQAPIS